MVTGFYVPSISADKKTEPFDLQLSRGLIYGHELIHKFGANDAVGTSFVPISDGGVYQTPTTVTALEVVSSSTNDTAAGSGAQALTLIGLDGNWDEVTEEVEMDGTDAVATANSYFRLYRAYVSRSGTYATIAGGSQDGDLTIRVASAGATWATIKNDIFDMAQTQIGCYTVPDRRIGYIASVFLHVDSNQSIDILFMQRPNADDVATPFSGALRTFLYLVGLKGSTTLKPRTPVGPFVGPCDLISFGKVGAATAAVSIDFEVMQVQSE